MMLTTATAWANTETLGDYTFTIETDAEGQYYKVDCKVALDAIATYVNTNHGNTYGKRFKQTANITYTHTTDWNDASSTENNFTGTFNGQGYTLTVSYGSAESHITPFRNVEWKENRGEVRFLRNE